MTQLDPIVNQPFLYVNGLAISNDATTPNTVLDIAAGQCRDSNNIIDMNLGNFLGQGNTTETINTVTLLNAAVNGINGLDSGTFAASTLYSIFVIGDSSNKNPVGTIMSVATIPVLPFGYDSYRRIGFWQSNSSIHFVLGFYTASGIGSRLFTYDTPLATSVTAGHATTYTAVNLTGLVPLINNLQVLLAVSITPTTAGDTLSLQPGNGTGASVVVTGQVTTVATSQTVTVNAQNTTISSVLSPTINYKVTAAGDTAVISVAGFYLSL